MTVSWFLHSLRIVFLAVPVCLLVVLAPGLEFTGLVRMRLVAVSTKTSVFQPKGTSSRLLLDACSSTRGRGLAFYRSLPGATQLTGNESGEFEPGSGATRAEPYDHVIGSAGAPW